MYKKVFLFFSLITLLLSCGRIENIENDIKDINNRLDSIDKRIDNIDTAIDVLEEMHANGMLISNIAPSDERASSWIITLSDGRHFEVYNGDSQSHTPYLKIDQEGYWCISYDNGVTFSRIIGNDGEHVKAPVAMYVTTDKEGYYMFVIHYANDPEKVIDVIKTPHTSDPSKIIHSITQNDADLSITITMSDGSSFTFDKEYTMPTSIAILSTRPTLLADRTTATIDFRVNPSNALFNYDVCSDSCQIELDCLTPTRAGSYVTPPTHYRLSAVEQVYDEQGVMKRGQYRAYIEDLGNSTLYDEDVALVLTVANRLGETVQLSSSAFEVKYADNMMLKFSFLRENNPSLVEDIHLAFDNELSCLYISTYDIDLTSLVATYTTNGSVVLVNNIEQISDVTANDFTQPVTYSVVSEHGDINRYSITILKPEIPIVCINIPNEAAIPSKNEEWLPDVEMKIIDSNGNTDYEGTIGIRGRGNSTWLYPKKPYALKLDSKASILGMPKHKRWVLLANYLDRTLLRNHVAFHISSLTSLPWTPRGQHVELIINGEHQGSYYLCEQIKIDENRVNIQEMESTDISGDAITGGYLMELDTHYDEVNKFYSSIRQLPYMFKEPDEEVLTTEQFEYMQNYINTLEDELYNNFEERKWAEYIDFTTFIDWWFVHELTNNEEPEHPKSCYMYKDRNDVLKAGPVWDFDWGTFTPDRSAEFHSVEDAAIYYKQLLNDSAFVMLVKERWKLLKPEFDKVPLFIEKESKRLEVTNISNIALWPYSERINGDETMTYHEAVQRMIVAYVDKLRWLDTQISNMQPPL